MHVIYSLTKICILYTIHIINGLGMQNLYLHICGCDSCRLEATCISRVYMYGIVYGVICIWHYMLWFGMNVCYSIYILC